MLAEIRRKKWRYLLVLGFGALVFLARHNFFIYRHVSFEDCRKGECVRSVPGQLTAISPIQVVRERFEIKQGGFYRVAIETETTAAVRLKISGAGSGLPAEELDRIEVTASMDLDFQQFAFRADKDMDRIILELERPEIGTSVRIGRVIVRKLMVNSLEEAGNETAIDSGQLVRSIEGQEQLGETGAEYPELRETKSVLGQTFAARSGFIDGVTLVLDYFRSRSGSLQYVLEIREAEKNGEPTKRKVAELRFSINGLEKYRQPDGTFFFPIQARLEPGKKYLLSLDNQKVEVDTENHLVWRGSGRQDAYPEGMAMIRRSGKWKKLDGDLAFAVRSAELAGKDGQKLLMGAVVEKTGRNSGRYAYRSLGRREEFTDISASSLLLRWDDDEGLARAETDGPAELEYEFNLGHPFRAATLKAEQAGPDWCPVDVDYSFDRKKWQPAGYSLKKTDDGDIRVFEQAIGQPKAASVIFLKVSCAGAGDGTKKKIDFGIRNLKLEAELFIK